MNTQATLSMQQKHILRRSADMAGRDRTLALNIALMRCLKHCTGDRHIGTDTELLLRLSEAACMGTQETLNTVIERLQLDLANTAIH